MSVAKDERHSAHAAGQGINVLEGSVDHHILQIHHFRLGTMQAPLDVGFLAIRAVIAVAGWRMTKAGGGATPPAK